MYVCMMVSDFFKGKKCGICGKDATNATFGRYLCDSKECFWKARDARSNECAGKTMKHDQN